MKKFLCSFAIGTDFHAMLDETCDPMRRYSEQHGYNPDLTWFTSLADVRPFLIGWRQPHERPASWYKVPIIYDLFAAEGADLVLWVDADVHIMKGSPDIAGDLVTTDRHGLVFHETTEGVIPNCGVWALRRNMMPVLRRIWDMTEYLNHCWWEQAAVISLLGGNPKQRPISLQKGELTVKRLDSRWNWHRLDQAKSSQPFFAHATQTNRMRSLKKWRERDEQGFPFEP